MTAKEQPKDVDAVLWLPDHFAELVERGTAEALVLEEMFYTRRPEELFAAESEED